MKKLIAQIVAATLILIRFASAQTDSSESFLSEVAAQWLTDAVGDTGRTAVNSVFMIIATKTQKKGTGFALLKGPVITNEHVIRNSRSSEVIALSSKGDTIRFVAILTDSVRDLAALIMNKPLSTGLLLGADSLLKVGSIVSTWGYPLWYSSPPPLLSVGYLSGFRAHRPRQSQGKIVKRLVVNGAFNPGNSGGPLFQSQSNRVVGIVVEKAIPSFNRFERIIVDSMASNNEWGTFWSLTDDQGKSAEYPETQLLARMFNQLREMNQTVIGEGITVSELRAFLSEKKIAEPN
jgi:S1-C subfamily serine protease